MTDMPKILVGGVKKIIKIEAGMEMDVGINDNKVFISRH